MIVFGGPSLNYLSIQLCLEKGVQLLDPVRRGDILNLTESSNPEIVLIADGIFHQQLAVSHEEILDAIKLGWEIHGVSSMGAIRAYELRDLGMKGFGKVYNRFISETDFQDDEVALLHLPPPDFRNMSEPLVHMRACLEDLNNRFVISQVQNENICREMKNKYFGDRTMMEFKRVFYEISGLNFVDIVSDFSIYQEKKNDLIEYLQNIPPTNL